MGTGNEQRNDSTHGGTRDAESTGPQGDALPGADAPHGTRRPGEGPGGPGEDSAPAPAPQERGREYRTAELAAAAGITARTLRFYRERKLLPPPRREGRIAWYDEHHLARLRTIAALLARGHTLGGIADLLDAFEGGRDSRGAAEILGLEAALTTPFSEETPVRLTPEELADHFQGEVTVENLAASMDIGYVAVDGDEFVHVSRRLLDASAELVREGVPLAAVLGAGRELRRQSEAIADVFTEIFRTHLLPKQLADASGAPDPALLSDLMERLRPIAKEIAQAELGLALDRRVRAELEEWLRSTETTPHAAEDPAHRPTPPSGEAAAPERGPEPESTP